jgi:hypothetical protein
MKTTTSILFFIALIHLSGFSQNAYYTGMTLHVGCRCQTAPVFKSRQNDMSLRPLFMSNNCQHALPVATGVSSVPEGFTFFKRNKKRPKPNYPKTNLNIFKVSDAFKASYTYLTH